MSFDTLSLSKSLIRAISNKGYNTPTPIQVQTIPLILERRDIMGRAQTGTGKTAGFTLPLLQIVNAQTEGHSKRFIRALILVPTRELAIQIEQSVKAYGKYLSLVSTVVFGGMRISSQVAKLRRGVDILIATPGRLVDLINQKKIDLSHVDIFVLDEADRLLDMGFIDDICKIIDFLPQKRQNLLFSATFTKRVTQLADKLLNTPIKIEVTPTNTISEQIKQIVHFVDQSQKVKLLHHLIDSQDLQQVLIFTRTKRKADQLANQLNKKGIVANAFHGDMNQRARIKALGGFKKGRTKALVATDIASRGIDIEQLSHVINFELPRSAEDYIHRIGRTGRSGNKGNAISLVSVDEYKFFEGIKKFLKCDLPVNIVPGYEPTNKINRKSARNKKFFGRPLRHNKKKGSYKRNIKKGFAVCNRKRRER